MQTARRWREPMRARAVDEEHRAATPLELLFDLTFVVAVAQAAFELAHALADDHPADGVVGYLMVFFAIWWAWMNFTWFASAYDCDDVPYRLLTLLQMGGVLVLAAGVSQAFQDQDFVAVTIGYVMMRAALVCQWLRAAHDDPAHRGTALRYAAGIAVLQVAWLLLLALDGAAVTAAFWILAVAELSVPIWAERGRMTTWHPHHIAERYGLFTLIVLGECVLSATVAARVAVTEAGWSADLLVLGAGSLLLLFGLWWLYFLKPAGEGLLRHREWAFWWGYGHYVVFAALAAVGAGLEVAAETVAHPVEASDTLVAFSIAVPVAVFMVAVWGLHAPLVSGRVADVAVVSAGAVAVLGVAAGSAAAGVPLPWLVVSLSLPVAALVTLRVVSDDQRASGGQHGGTKGAASEPSTDRRPRA